MRSLDRPGLYRIFAPLDPDERLPRELVVGQRQHDTWSRGSVAALLWPVGCFVVLAVAFWISRQALVALAALAPLFGAFWAYAHSGRR